MEGSDALVIAALAAGGYSLFKAFEEQPTSVAGKPTPPPQPTSQKKPNLPILNPPNNPPVNNPPVNNPPVNNPPVNNPPFNNPPANNPPFNNPPVNNPPANNPPANNPPVNNPPVNNPPVNNPPVNNPPAPVGHYLNRNNPWFVDHMTGRGHLNSHGDVIVGDVGMTPPFDWVSNVGPDVYSDIPNYGRHGHPEFSGDVAVQGSNGVYYRPTSLNEMLLAGSVGSTLKKSRPQLMKLYRNEFPDLTVEVVERFTNSFNCIAWTIGVRDRWVWNEIDTNGDGLSSFSEFVSFYGRHGLLPTTVESEADVAIFGFESFGKIDVKHGAVREKGSNYWLSKMGQGGIIRHEGLNAFDTSPYGKLLLMFKRV